MYKLRFTAETEAELLRAQADEAYFPTVVIDRAVQCDPLAESGWPQLGDGSGGGGAGAAAGEVAPFQSLARREERPSSSSLAALDEVGLCFSGGASSPAFGGSSPPVRSGGPSPAPWNLDEEEVGEAEEGGSVERVVLPLYSGHPSAELCAGSVSFYRFEHPAGVLSLSPPPLRSNVLAMLNVPTSMTAAELLRFIGAYLRCIKRARLVRDAARPHACCVLLQFVSSGLAERFRRDFHGRRFNSLEPEVLLAVHVAEIEFAKPQPPPPPDVRVSLHLLVTTLQRGIDGALQPAGTPAGWSGETGSERTPRSGKEPRSPALEEWPASREEERQLQAAIRRSLRPATPPLGVGLLGESAAEGAGPSGDAGGASEAAGAAEETAAGGPAGGAGEAEGGGAAPSSPQTPQQRPPFRVVAQVVPTLGGKGRLRPMPEAPPLPAADPALGDALSRGERVAVDPVGAGSHVVALGDSSAAADGGAAVEGSSRGGSTELGSSTELPLCAVCLERLDPEVSGVLTILCNHTFHNDCLRQWDDPSCPVCRHVSGGVEESATSCEICGTGASLWICLVCGHVGCGRYGCGAGVIHNERTGHNFAMELGSQRVWDYAADGYVHRLIQNRVDGKLVELPHPGGDAGGRAPAARGDSRGQVDAAALEMKQRRLEDEHEAVVHEYSLLLTGQLEVQRQHFEAQLEAATRAHAAVAAELEASVERQRAELRGRAEQVERKAHAQARRSAASDALLSSVRGDLAFNKQLNEQLVANQAEFAAQAKAAGEREAALQGQVRELEEQLRDMSIHLEAQMKMLEVQAAEGGAAAELNGAHVMPGEPPPARKGRRGRKG